MNLHHTSDALCPLCEEKLKDAHPLLADWYRQIKLEFPDAHLSWVFRGQEDQDRFFAERRTKCKWPNSEHNKKPSRAMDLFQIRPDKVSAWPEAWFKRISDWCVEKCAPLEWGGTWKSIGDGDHFQLKRDALAQPTPQGGDNHG